VSEFLLAKEAKEKELNELRIELIEAKERRKGKGKSQKRSKDVK
jgi:hypothetical protein